MQFSSFIKNINSNIQQKRDNRLSKRLVDRLLTLDKCRWLYVRYHFNKWQFPIEFYDLIPKWWSLGTDFQRASNIIRPLMETVNELFNEKQFLCYCNVVHGDMTKDEFEYWYSIISPRQFDKLSEYYKKVNKVKNIRWWEDEVFKQLLEANIF